MSGQPVKGNKMWRVRDPQRLLELIETARAATRPTAA